MPSDARPITAEMVARVAAASPDLCPRDATPDLPASTARTSAGDWPRTTRVLPWLVALFMLMVFWVPFDSTALPISLPINSDLDRFVIGAMVLVWVVVALARPQSISFRSAPINVAIFLFIAAAVASLAANLHSLAWDGELTLALKQLSLIVSYLAAFLVIATSIRRTEVTAFVRLLVVLGIGTALGTVYEYITGVDLFFTVAQTLFIGAHVTSVASGITSLLGPGSRPSITGPALHGLADATLISAAFPFCLCFASDATRSRDRALWWLAIIILIAGDFATGRKTALVVLAIDFVVLLCYDTRRYLRYLLAPAVAAIVLLIIAPNSVKGLFYQVSTASSSSSTSARAADYSAVLPDVASHLLIGRGYGSFDPLKYRILDDQMLGWLVEIGVLGAASYVLMVLSAAMTVHPVARTPRSPNERLMQAVVAASLGYLVTNFLYDTFGFRQAPYSFFIVAALGVVCAGSRTRLRAPPDVHLIGCETERP